MLANIGLYSYGLASTTFGLLTVMIALSHRKQLSGLAAAVAALSTALWAGSVVYSSLQPYPLIILMQLTEAARNAAWIYLLLKVLGLRFVGTDHVLATGRWRPWFYLACLLPLGVLVAPALLPEKLQLADNTANSLVFTTWLGMAILALLLVEQIFRNSDMQERWSIKHFCIGVGVIFAYDFFMYAEALLFRQLDANLWQSRGFVVSMAAIFIAVAVGRMERPATENRVIPSRHVVFHSVTLMLAGIYLLLMAVAGYFIQYLGGSWGGVLQITFLFAAGLLLLVLMFSGQIRARFRVWLSKNFFSYKYDYRVEWLRFTEMLATGQDNVLENIIQAMGKLNQSPSGLLWGRSDDTRFTLIADSELAVPENPDALGNLPDWLESTGWIIDINEWRRSPDLYAGLEMPQILLDIPRAWLVTPLMFGDKLQGILLLRESDLQSDLNWEDRDLLKVAGRQAASHLAQYQANEALVQSRQFEAFHRLSAYVIHDLKNILAQQSLIVSNAAKHRGNPAFVDDVIDTIENSVSRMTRLMEQMRSGVRGSETEPVELCSLLQDAISERAKATPHPTLETCDEELVVNADRTQLATVFNHIIQNAQEATSRTGSVIVRVAQQAGRAIVEIKDNGVGMDENFLRDKLFQPFESTKGLTGMGIGTFESREFIRSLGGDIRVQSTPGSGSVFRIELPIAARPDTSAKLTGTGQ